MAAGVPGRHATRWSSIMKDLVVFSD